MYFCSSQEVTVTPTQYDDENLQCTILQHFEQVNSASAKCQMTGSLTVLHPIQHIHSTSRSFWIQVFPGNRLQ